MTRINWHEPMCR